MRISSVVTSLLKQSKHNEFLLAILQWEIFHGNNAVWEMIVNLFLYHVHNQTVYQKIAMHYLHQISRNNRINVSHLQQQKNKIYHTLLQQTTEVTENNIQTYIAQYIEKKPCNYLYRARYFPQRISPYLLVVSTIESICKCFEVNEQQLLECVYKGILNVDYRCEKVIFDYDEIVDFLFPREHIQEFVKIPEVHLSQVLSLVANGEIIAFYCNNELHIYKADLEKYIPGDLDERDFPGLARTTTSFINEIPIRNLQKMLGLKQRVHEEILDLKKPKKRKKTTPLRLSKSKRTFSVTIDKEVLFKTEGRILKKIKEFLSPDLIEIYYGSHPEEEKDEKATRGRLQHDKKQEKVFEVEQDLREEPEVISSTAGKHSKVFQRYSGEATESTDLVDRELASNALSESLNLRILPKIFNILIAPIKIPIILAYSVTKFLFLGVVNVFKMLFLYVKRQYSIAGIDIPIFEAMLSEEAGRPGIVERTIAQSESFIKSLQAIVGLRVLVVIHLVDRLLDFIAGYVNNIYRTWKISKSIKKRIQRRDSKKQIEGINSELQIARYQMSRLFCLPHFCPYTKNKYVDEVIALELVLEIRYRLDEMKRDLSILTTSQMEETAKKSLWDFAKSFVPNPIELITPWKDFIIFAFFMRYSRRDLYVMYAEVLVSYRFIIKNLNVEENLVIEHYEQLMIDQVPKTYEQHDIETHIEECKLQLQRIIQMLTNPQKIVDVHYLDLADLWLECKTNKNNHLSTRFYLEWEKRLNHYIEKHVKSIRNPWLKNEKSFFYRRYLLQKKLANKFI
ncbi:hypothetical protein [Candidatus Uabimicrobium sp. HlEnr_7]|uniref:hypothetical protein n=1 Tax=Candidatus Uabimicrobium helgolandensis TaxID=3095367 RepID=UPI0035592A22